jgi:hypothetical protein
MLRARRRVAARTPNAIDLDRHRDKLACVKAAPELVGAQPQHHAPGRGAAHVNDLAAQVVSEAAPDELEVWVDAVRRGERLQQARSSQAMNDASRFGDPSQTQSGWLQHERPTRPVSKHLFTAPSAIDSLGQ